MRRRSIAFLAVLLVARVGGPALLAADNYEVVHGWPILPDGFAFREVSGVGVDSHNHVWVFHRGENPIMVFDGPTGKLLSAFGTVPHAAPGMFAFPGMFKMTHGLTVDAHDNVWLTDAGQHQIFKFNTDGQLLMTLGVKDKPGLDATHFNRPTDIAVAPTGEFYVSDGYGNSRVVKFDKEGKFLFDWGKKGTEPGEFDAPHGITLDNQGRVYVADRGNGRIQVFDGDGKFLRQWRGPQIGRPWAVTFAKDRYLYVVDGGDINPNPPDRARIIKMDLDGKVIEQFGTYGKYDGQFHWPHDVAVAPNGEVYVCDVSLGMRVQKFVRK